MNELTKNTSVKGIQNISHSHSHVLLKRLMDIALAILVLPAVCVLCSVFALIFWALTKQNPLFVQTRVGMHQRPFKLFKLRTMRADTEDLPTHEVSRENIPRVGRVMRAIKVDELPQLLNVLKGNMSLVGPRPCLPFQYDLIDQREKAGVFSIKPGITGLAQIHGIDMSQPIALVQEDLRYLNSNSLTGDLGLMLQTVLGKGRGDRTAR